MTQPQPKQVITNSTSFANYISSGRVGFYHIDLTQKSAGLVISSDLYITANTAEEAQQNGLVIGSRILKIGDEIIDSLSTFRRILEACKARQEQDCILLFEKIPQGESSVFAPFPVIDHGNKINREQLSLKVKNDNLAQIARSNSITYAITNVYDQFNNEINNLSVEKALIPNEHTKAGWLSKDLNEMYQSNLSFKQQKNVNKALNTIGTCVDSLTSSLTHVFSDSQSNNVEEQNTEDTKKRLQQQEQTRNEKALPTFWPATGMIDDEYELEEIDDDVYEKKGKNNTNSTNITVNSSTNSNSNPIQLDKEKQIEKHLNTQGIDISQVRKSSQVMTKDEDESSTSSQCQTNSKGVRRKSSLPTNAPLVDVSHKELTSLAFNLHRPFGLEIGRENMIVLKITPKSQSERNNVLKRWIVKKVGRDKVNNMEEFVDAIVKRRNRGDAEVILHFDILFNMNSHHEGDDLKKVSSDTMDVIRVKPRGQNVIKLSTIPNSTISLLDAAIKKGESAQFTKSKSNKLTASDDDYQENDYMPGVLV